MGKKQRNRRAIGEQGKIFSPAPHLVGVAGTVLNRKLKPLRRSRSDKVREKALEQDYLEKSNRLACQLKSHGRLLDFIGELTCCSREDFCDSDVGQELKERHAKSSAVIKFLLEQLGYDIDVLSKQIRVSLHEMLCKDKKLEKVLKGDKQGGIFKGKTTFLNQVPSVQEDDITSIDEFYQMFVHGIEADRPLVLTLKRGKLGGALREAVQKKCPNLPSSFILLHQGRKICVDHTLKEQGLTQDCNIHIHFGLCGGMEKEKDLAAATGGEKNNKAPQKWKKARVVQWIDDVCEEYEIEKDEVSELKTVSGAGLMKLKRQDWKERSPKQGDLLFNLWTELLQETQELSGIDTTKSPPNSPIKGIAVEGATNDVASGAGQELKPTTLSRDGEQLVLGAGAVSCSSQERDWNQKLMEAESELVDERNQKSELVKKCSDHLDKLKEANDELQKKKAYIDSLERNVTSSAELLKKKDQEMKDMKDRYETYLEKAKSVIKTLDPKQNQGLQREMQLLKTQVQEKDKIIEHLERDHEKMKITREREEKLIVSAWYEMGMQLHRKAAEEQLSGSTGGMSFLDRQRTASSGQSTPNRTQQTTAVPSRDT